MRTAYMSFLNMTRFRKLVGNKTQLVIFTENKKRDLT